MSKDEINIFAENLKRTLDYEFERKKPLPPHKSKFGSCSPYVFYDSFLLLHSLNLPGQFFCKIQTCLGHFFTWEPSNGFLLPKLMLARYYKIQVFFIHFYCLQVFLLYYTVSYSCSTIFICHLVLLTLLTLPTVLYVPLFFIFQLSPLTESFLNWTS